MNAIAHGGPSTATRAERLLAHGRRPAPKTEEVSPLAVGGRLWGGVPLPTSVPRLLRRLASRRALLARPGLIAPGTMPLEDVLLVGRQGAAGFQLASLLERAGVPKVTWTTSVRGAEAALAMRSYGLIVCDLKLPDAQGLDVLRRLRAACPGGVTVVVSGDADRVAADALAAGAQEVLHRRGLEAYSFQQALLRALARGSAARELDYRATHDGLTGLRNAPALRDSLGAMIARAQHEQTQCAVLYVDLDAFKPVNDRFGHAAGDEVLRIVAARMRGCLRDGDLAARVGGDEFVVVLQDAASPLVACGAAERLLRCLCDPITVSAGKQVRVTASIGVAIGPIRGEEMSDLLTRADRAMFTAKSRGRDRCCLAPLGRERC